MPQTRSLEAGRIPRNGTGACLRFCLLSCVFCLLSLAVPRPAAAQFEYWPGADYDPSIPTFDSVLGHGPGERIVSHAEILEYFEALAEAAPDRFRLFDYATSWEGRRLIYAVVGSADKIGRLDHIKADIERLADPRATDPEAAAELIERLPAIAWLAYGVHGNEISSPDAGLLTAYHLLAARDDEVTEEILAGALVVIDPTQNPDGRDRFVHNFRIAAGLEPSASRWAAEHNEPWPGGRTNHYYFDLNRDYYALTQPETRGRVAALREWYPPVVVDLHEMGTDSTYYFAPSAKPTNPHMTVEQKANEELFGRNNAQWFDYFGFDYFTREIFDAFYPGYGDSWPNFYGAVGMTYEQASVRGLVVRRSDGSTMHFRDSVQHHFVASIATAQVAARHRKTLLGDLYEYRRSAIEEGEAGDIRAFVLPRRGDTSAVDELAALLDDQGVHVEQMLEPSTGCGADLPAGSYIIPLAQPAKRLIRTLLDPDVPLAEDFMAEQERRRAKKLSDQIYDITAWSLPLTHGVESIPCPKVPDAGTKTFEPRQPTAAALPEAGVAYVVPWGSLAAGRLLSRALREGLTVLSADKTFTQNGTIYPSGSLIFKVADNPDSLHGDLERLAAETAAQITATDTSWVEEGVNFGSANVVRMRPIRIAMAWDRPTSAGSAGATRYVLERRFAYPTTPIRTAQLAAADLSRFDVLVLPSGGDYSTLLDTRGTERLQDWVSSGGVLIGIEGAMSFLTDPEVALLASQREDRLDGGSAVAPEEDSESDGSSRAPAIELESEEEYLDAIEPATGLPDAVPGTLVRAHVDPDHWLTAGLPDTVHVMVRGRSIYTPLSLDKGVNAVRFAAAEDLVAAGYLWDENRRQLAFKPFVLVQPRGRGFVIGFTADPNFRGYMHGLNVLFLNAVFRGPAHARPSL